MNEIRSVLFLSLCLSVQVTAWPGVDDPDTRTIPQPQRHQVVPRGTMLSLTVVERKTSGALRHNELITFELSEPVVVGQRVAVPVGSVIEGRVVRVRRPGFVARRARLRIRLERLIVSGTPFRLDTTDLKVKGRTTFGSKVLAGLKAAAVGQVSPAAGILIGASTLSRRGPQINLLPGRRLDSCLTEGLIIPREMTRPPQGKRRSQFP